jgi:hypothetical protein
MFDWRDVRTETGLADSSTKIVDESVDNRVKRLMKR